MLDPNAAAVAERLVEQAKEVDDAWQIPPEEAALLHQLVVACGCRSILEIGVSYGYSTLHLAHAVRINHGHMHAIDASEKKIDAATENLTDAGLAHHVTLHLGRAQAVLPVLSPRRPFDFLFIDAVKTECFEYYEAARTKLAEQCIIVTDNTSTHAAQLADFVGHLRSLPEIVSSESIELGNGFELSVRRRKPFNVEGQHHAWTVDSG